MMPMLIPLAAIVAGILACRAGAGVPCAVAAAVAAIVFAVRRCRGAAVACALLTAATVSALVAREGELPPSLAGVAAKYSGVIENIKEHEANQTLTMVIDSINGESIKPFTASLTVPTFDFKPTAHDRVSVNCILSPPDRMLDLPDEIDPASLRKGHVAGFVPADSFKTFHPEPGITHTLGRLRAEISHTVFQCGMQSETSAFVNALLTGDTSAIDPDTRNAFSQAGLAHILALSGMHLALIVWIAGLLIYPLFPSATSPGRRLSTMALIWFFAIMTGLSASVTRAAVMLTVLLAGGMLRRRHSSFNSLFLASSLILLADPGALFSAGFQLSVAAVASILAVTPVIDGIPHDKRAFRTPLTMLCVPLAAMTGTALIAAYHFHALPVNFLGANILSSWIVAPLMLSGAAAAATGLPPLIRLTDKLYEVIDSIATAFASLPGIEKQFYPTAAGTVLGCATIAIIIFAIRRKRPLLMAPALLSAVLCLMLEAYDRPAEHSATKAYFARSLQSLDIVIHTPGRLIITTTAPAKEHYMVADRANMRYSRFMGRRGIRGAEVVTDFTIHGANRVADTLMLGHRRFCLLADNNRLPVGWRGIPVATSRFRGDILDVVSNASVDTVMISSDVNPRRTASYVARLTLAGYTPVDLRRQPVNYTLY